MTAPQLSPGYVIAGKYSVQTMLGHGGSSATYGVVDASGRQMAVRMYSPAIAQRPEVMTMIEQIYSATNAMPPDAVLPVMDAGYDQPTAAPFTVTELSPAPSLSQLVSQRPLSPQEVSQIAQNLGRTLDQAHARGLMHHALKPANVFVSPQGFSVRVMDFGAGLARSYVQTNEGYATAAPWVAPEQMQGGVQAGAQADVFAMALVLFYALTGRSYWRSCQGPQPDLASWQHELVSPRMPASQRAQELGAQISPVLDAVFNRAFSIDPNERFRQASELAAAFSAAVNMPEVATGATIAFPSMGTGADPMGPTAAVPVYQPPGQGHDAGSGYPPPPPPGGGMGGPGGPGMGGPGGPGMGGPGMGGPGMDAGMGAGMGMGPGPGPNAPTTAAQRPTFDAGGGGGNSKTMPILIGVAAVVLIGGAIGAWIIFGKKKADDTDTPIVITPTAASASTGESGGAAPPPTGTGATAPAAAESDVTIKCSPACDEIKIDDKKIEDPSKPTKIAVGTHKVSVSKAGYVAQTDDIEVKAGEAFTKEYKLAAEPKEAPPPPEPTAKTSTTTKSTGGTTTKTGGSTTTKKTCTGVGLFKKCK